MTIRRSILALALAACAATQTTSPEQPVPEPADVVQDEPAEALSNRQKVVALLESLETGAAGPVGYIDPNQYIQHNLGVADGLEGFGAVMADKPVGGFRAKVIRSFEDGDFVVAHTEYDFFGPKIGFDVFRFENGLIVEHWDNLIDVMPPNPSGHTQTDGPTEISDTDETDANKALVREFYQTILVDGQMDRVGEFFDGDAYIQHNPQIADGLSGLGAALKAMAEQGVVMKMDTIHNVLGAGNFVLVMAEGSFGGKPFAYYDLFRVQDGKIAEHWDVMAEIPPKSEWKNDNGKF
ncbi:MAG: nuclear transport factor 2 family protein [Myxococcales bacterium]|nr:nuclear transport factor 2 family protein [Myxococcales bacterium]